MIPNLPSVVRRAGLEPAPLSGGDFKSVQALSNDNNLAPAPSIREAASGNGRNTREGWLATNLATSHEEVAA